MNIETRTRTDKNGREVKSYVARVYHPGLGKPLSKTFPRKEDAKLWGVDIERKVRLGQSIERARDITIGQLAEHYLATLSERTRKKRKVGVDKWVSYFGKNKIVSHIQRSEIRTFRDRLRADYKRDSADTYLSTLKAALNIAVDDGYIPSSPAAGRLGRSSDEQVKASKEQGKATPRKGERALTHEQHERIVAAVPEQWKPLVYVWPRCGLRIGEMRALRWENVHLDAKKPYIDVIEQWQDGYGVCPPKSGSSGKVEIGQTAVRTLREWSMKRGRPETGLVFPGRAGDPFCQYHFSRRVLSPAAAKAGVEWVTPHTMRHTFGSWIYNGGEPLTYVQKQMRHAKLQTTIDCYLHDTGGDSEGRADAVDGRGAVHSPFTQDVEAAASK